MTWHYTSYTLPLLFSAGVSLLLAVYIWRRRPGAGVIPLLILVLAATEWTIGHIMELGVAGLEAKLFWARIQYLGILTVSPAWLVFALEYTGKKRWLTLRNYLLLLIEPVLVLAVFVTGDPLHVFHLSYSLSTDTPIPIFVAEVGPLFWLHAAYSYVLLLSGTVLLARMLWKSSQVYRGQAVALVIAVLAPWLGNAIYLSDLSLIDLTPIAFSISGVALAWAVFRYQLLDIVPIARDAVIENMSDGVITLDARNRIVDLNPAARVFLKPDETTSAIVGLSIEHLLPGIAGLFRDNQHIRTEVTIGGPTGPRILALRGSPLYDRRHRLTGHLIMLEDVTDRKQTEAALRESEARYRSLFTATFEAIVIHDQGTVLDVNQAFEEIFGYTRDEIIGQSALILAAPESRDTVQANITAGLEEPYEAIGQRKDGTTFASELRARRITYQGRTVRVVAIRDISVSKRAREELRRANEHLIEANRLKTQFMANMSHELRTPLNSILGYTQMLLEGIYGPLSDMQRDRLEKVTRNGHQLLQLINDILDISRIEANRMPLELEPVDLADLLADCYAEMEPLAQHSGLELHCNISPLPPVLADKIRLRQVIINLVHNAIKFTPEGSITVSARTVAGDDPILPPSLAAPGTHRALITVKDTGVGIAPKAQHVIFEAFRQADGSTTRVYGGTGLGLAIARRLVEMMNGNIWVTSQEGEGSTFYVVLPLTEQTAPAHIT